MADADLCLTGEQHDAGSHSAMWYIYAGRNRHSAGGSVALQHRARPASVSVVENLSPLGISGVERSGLVLCALRVPDWRNTD
jgi:hypothetical protein